MQVRMRVQISGTRDGVDWPAPGESIKVGDGEGRDLCAAGLAEPIAEEPRKATARKAEKRG